MVERETRKQATVRTKSRKGKGLRLQRFFTQPGQDPFGTIAWTSRTSKITNPDGSVVFEMKDAEIPASWSQVATDIMVSKYFRKAGVPQYDESGNPLLDEHGKPVLGAERSAKQVISRLAGTWRYWGEQNGYFATSDDANVFEAELQYMLVHQMAAPNSPQWFNTGLHWAYGISGPAQGHTYVDPATNQVVKSTDAYSRPTPHACFIQSVNDDLINEGGIFDLVTREARVFKYGSGTGTNFSMIARRGRAALGRRYLLRPDELPEDRRPRGRRDQEWRHHPARRQDGRRRHRSSRHREVHQVEGRRGAEGRRPDRCRLFQRLQR